MQENLKTDSKLDLIFERTTPVPVEKLWKAWTQTETLKKWFCPRPWKVTECRIDLRPGGEFFTLMSGPNGEQMPNRGCYLEVIENKKLIWTNIMSPGYRPSLVPSSAHTFSFVATILFSKTEKGTLYKAIVKHGDEEDCKKHEKMGFQEGWSLAFDQLMELIRNEDPS